MHWGLDTENLHRRLFIGMLVGKGSEYFRDYSDMYWGPDAENLHRRLFFGMLVGSGTASLGTSVSQPCLFSLHESIADVYNMCMQRGRLMPIVIVLTLACYTGRISQERMPLTSFLKCAQV